MIKLIGKTASPGYAVGDAFVLNYNEVTKEEMSTGDINTQKMLFERSLEISKSQISNLLANKNLSKTESDIINFQLEVLNDESFISKIRKKILEGSTAYEAIKKSFEEAIKELNEANSEYLRERTEDLQDLMERMITNLSIKEEGQVKLNSKIILVANVIKPSSFAALNKEMLLGIITEEGGTLSHVAIMAKERGIPMVVGVENATKIIKNGDKIILDGYLGTVIVNPTDKDFLEYNSKIMELQNTMVALEKLIGSRVQTTDGVYIKVQANIGNVNDLSYAIRVKAEGIGLLRTEFLYFERENAPKFTELFEFFKKTSESFPGEEVIIRTLDIGGDKIPGYLNFIKGESNPFLGLRGIRLTLKYKDILKEEMKAIVLSNVHGNLKIMLPMVSDYSEVVEAHEVFKQVIEELRKNTNVNIPELGIMIETPSAAIMTDRLSEISDFFSIGTNDLTQYMLAADRENSNVAYLYDDMHPSVLRMIKIAVENAKKPIGVCGEMASEPLAIPLLIGLKVKKLSVNPSRVLSTKLLITKISEKEAVELADTALSLKTASEVKSLVKDFFQKNQINIM